MTKQGEVTLVSAGFRNAARVQFDAEMAEARAYRDERRNWRLAAIIGTVAGFATAAILMLTGLA